jgi:uncharacterized protein YuzE
MMKIQYDKAADALYIALLDKPWAYTKTLDDARNVDYSAGHEVIGVELLCVSAGVDLSDIPQADQIEKALLLDTPNGCGVTLA